MQQYKGKSKREKRAFFVYAINKNPYQHAHLHSLIRTFIIYFQNHRILLNISKSKEGLGQTATAWGLCCLCILKGPVSNIDSQVQTAEA